MQEDIRREIERIFREKKSITEETRQAYKNIQKRTEKPSLPTGIGLFDDYLHGLTGGQLLTIAARPSNGKSSLATQICQQVCDVGKTVLFISLEMTKEQIIERMFCQCMDVKADDLWKGKITPGIRKKMELYLEMIKSYKLLIIDDYCREEMEVKSLFEYMPTPPQVVFVDHIQHIRSRDYRRSERETIAEYVRTLKEQAMKKNIAIVALSQINREGDEKPSLSTLKSSGAIEEMSDAVILLSLQKPSSTSTEREAVLDIAKNRFGRIVLRKMVFKSENCFFSEMVDNHPKTLYDSYIKNKEKPGEK